MILIVGLGNPGKKFERTRHNIGFRVVDGFVRKNNFPKFLNSKELSSFLSEGKFDKERLTLANPQTFMNFSGKAVKALINFYKITSPGLVVIHDDMDVPLGKIRISKNRGAAGHKGVESIIDEIGTKDFVRFRIGIKPSEKLKAQSEKQLEKFVLEKFTKKEEKFVKEVIGRTTDAIEFSLKEGVEKAMSKYN